MKRVSVALCAGAAMLIATPWIAQAQSMRGMDHGHMDHGPAPEKSAPAAPDHDMAGMDHSAMSATGASGTDLPAGDAPAPDAPMDHYADRQFPAADMARSRMTMMREQGGQSFYQIMFNLAEMQVRDGREGYRWDGEGWFGGDIHRVTIKSQGEGRVGRGLEAAEVQALYSRAIGPYFNIQAGVRHDLRPSPSRTYAVIGFEGLAPYWFEVEGAAFLSDKGDLLGRLEAYYDQRLTQRLVLQPRVELNLSAQDVRKGGIGAGLVDAELGLRLRYEIDRRFAPYVGISHEAKAGKTADYARAIGVDPSATSVVVGLRLWL